MTQGQDPPTTVGFTLSQPAGNVNIAIQDASGNTVRTIGVGPVQDLKNNHPWDGKDDKGNPLQTGTYTAQVSATDLQGNPITVTQSVTARITGMTFANGTPTLLAGTTSLQLSDITELDE
jgi:flagellar basal-body rod modification protein FlgD